MLRQIAVAVVVREGLVLVGRRPADAADAAGCAEFPGGKVEAGETSAAAAARECLEEAGIAIRLLERTVRVESPEARPALCLWFHWAVPLDPAAAPRAPFAWVPIAELSPGTFPRANAEVLAILRADRSRRGAMDGTGRCGQVP